MGYKLTPRWLNDKAWIGCSTPEGKGRNACHPCNHPYPSIHGYSHSPLTRMQPLADLYCTLVPTSLS